jgi:hypothetical protein
LSRNVVAWSSVPESSSSFGSLGAPLVRCGADVPGCRQKLPGRSNRFAPRDDGTTRERARLVSANIGVF